MDALMGILEKIYKTLEQIYSITQNQNTILRERQFETEALELLEEMSTYKEHLTKEIEEDERLFQTSYDRFKDTLKDDFFYKDLKNKVEAILAYKEAIIACEQNNVLLMQSLARSCHERVQVPKPPQQVVKAYHAQQKQSTPLND